MVEFKALASIILLRCKRVKPATREFRQDLAGGVMAGETGRSQMGMQRQRDLNEEGSYGGRTQLLVPAGKFCVRGSRVNRSSNRYHGNGTGEDETTPWPFMS
eukprot:272925-Hanusia_phi.AAC.3